jgi:hypothetical protein
LRWRRLSGRHAQSRLICRKAGAKRMMTEA